jgi:hypothetical protein
MMKNMSIVVGGPNGILTIINVSDDKKQEVSFKVQEKYKEVIAEELPGSNTEPYDKYALSMMKEVIKFP